MKDFLTGTIKWFDETKGFGFIKQDNGPDIFAHLKDLKDMNDVDIKRLKKGQNVFFNVIKGQKGPTAVAIRLDRDTIKVRAATGKICETLAEYAIESKVEIMEIDFRIGEPQEYIDAVESLRLIHDELNLIAKEMTATFSKHDEIFNSFVSDIEGIESGKEVAG